MVTITTVGYGDISPVTPVGQFVSMIVMLLGYSIIAVPTGIVAGETLEEHKRTRKSGTFLRRHMTDNVTNQPEERNEERPAATDDKPDTEENEPPVRRPSRELDPGAHIRPEDLM